MRKYETLMVLNPELPEAQTRETIDRARRLIEEMGGRVEQIQEWGMRELAYPIRKLSRGYYVLAEYMATPAVVKELERNLKISEEFLRFLSVAAPTGRRARVAEKRPPQREDATGEAAGETGGGFESEIPVAD